MLAPRAAKPITQRGAAKAVGYNLGARRPQFSRAGLALPSGLQLPAPRRACETSQKRTRRHTQLEEITGFDVGIREGVAADPLLM